MKICIAAESFLYYMGTKDAIFGGAETLLMEISRLLVADGHDVTVIQMGNEAKEFEYEGIKVKQVKTPVLRYVQKLFVRRWFWAGLVVWPHIDKDADWVHFHYHYMAFPLAGRLKCRVTGMNHGVDWNVPWVYDKVSLKHTRDRFSFACLKLVTRFTVSKLDRLITNDYFFTHYTTHRRPNLLKKFAYIPNFTYTDRFRPDVAPLPGFREKFPGCKLILLPKMAMRDRGTDIMYECLVRMKRPDVRLIITGTSSSVPEFVKIARDMGLENRVHFAGHVDFKSELPGIYAAADIVVVPSPCREATAIAMLEGMAMGKPMVIANIGGLTEVAKDRYNCLVRDATVEGFSGALEELLDNPELGRELGRNAHQFIVKAYNKDFWDARIREFFDPRYIRQSRG
jgi:glycosyltransferase involved in cell wall biosynthesis